ncbi:phosphatidate cytidylyltransferase [Caldibacillus thermolactis]|jgi:phosphatidate cytidylyltransferase|uniref:Phosphatidate cytidylyltransferase n=1 Tax=Pallidibacillus thermolactis TaxID=251051 RepID=A0ABT2WC36_9BACI|nr:phosphatidate cytidylyltransferase [Pallidibacillus thermolactis]MCU9593060.1 phosphatidate cytidylyltransferase [Pallidibacillus thermolactis]MCU9600726.1 phosphatidate cytidylyltransferase [Pallidibacillus thermolactis subsp. kokeshiiformis]MED1672038.1 phosphatidate cytidylyltransferase [Pallidibacillus thermolactis subsp. kokeshiiformis]
MIQRIITGVIAALIFLPLTFIGGIPFLILIYAMASVALFEVLRMKNIDIRSFPGIFSLLILWVFLIPIDQYPLFSFLDLELKIELIFFGFLILMTYSIMSHNKFSFENVAYSVLTILYIGIGFFYIIETRMEGILYIFFALFLIWATDSGAYFIGRKFGKKKLAPTISPNKTVEGSIGGVICALIVMLIFFFFTNLGQEYSLIRLFLITIVLSAFGQLGDLVESALKRLYDVKDSGNILPGHGGILDRVDSWLFVMPLLHFLQFI